MNIQSFEKLQHELSQKTKLEAHLRYCYTCLLDAREMRKALTMAGSIKARDMKHLEQIWKRSYWKASENLNRYKQQNGLI